MNEAVIDAYNGCIEALRYRLQRQQFADTDDISCISEVYERFLQDRDKVVESFVLGIIKR